MPDELVNVRYMVDDVEAPIDFYTTHFGFRVRTNAAPAFADVLRGNLRLLLSGPTSSAGRPMPDGRTPGAGRLEPHPPHRRRHRRPRSSGCAAPGSTFRNEIVSGPGGQQIVLDDPSGNPIELFQPARRDRSRPASPTARTPSGCARSSREWGRIGCIGFGGPPAHIALLRELCVDAARLARAEREFEDAIAACNLLPGPGVDPARDLLRLAAARPAGSARRRRRLHRARAGRHPRARRAVPRRLAAGLGAGRRRRRGRGRRRGRAPAPAGASPRRAGARAARTLPLGRCTSPPAPSPRRPSGRGSCSSCSAAAPLELRCGRAMAAAAPSLASHAWPLAPRPRPAGCWRSPGWRSRSARSPTAAAS